MLKNDGRGKIRTIWRGRKADRKEWYDKVGDRRGFSGKEVKETEGVTEYA
jgi:hypothetical protein